MGIESGYDLEYLAAGIGFSVEDYAPLLEAFVDETSSDIDRLRKSISEGDRKSVSELLHNIRGASLNLGLDTISGYVEEMSLRNKKGEYVILEEILNKCACEVDIIKGLLQRWGNEEGSGCR